LEALEAAAQDMEEKANKRESMTLALTETIPFGTLGDGATRREARRGTLLAGLRRLSGMRGPLPDDPYAPGQPLRIAQRGGAFVVYSVGKNGTDEKGDLTRGRDVGFEFGMKP
jgi:hypothetical protein